MRGKHRLLLEPPVVKVEPPRGAVQDKAGDERRRILATVMAEALRRSVLSPDGVHYRIAAVYFEELPG
jgi:hypothetical protein